MTSKVEFDKQLHSNIIPLTEANRISHTHKTEANLLETLFRKEDSKPNDHNPSHQIHQFTKNKERENLVQVNHKNQENAQN